MEVILQEDFPLLGYVGDKVSVRRGYARNFLLPRGLAIEISSKNAKLLKHKLEQINAKKARLKQVAEQEAERVGAVSLSFKLKVGKKGKSFGSITAKDIETGLNKAGVEIDRRRIKLSEPIKVPGEHQVHVKLHSEVTVPITVEVIAEVIKEDSSATKASPKKGGKKASKGKAAQAEGAEDSTEDSTEDKEKQAEQATDSLSMDSEENSSETDGVEDLAEREESEAKD